MKVDAVGKVWMACWLLGDMSHHEFHAALYSKNLHFQGSILTKIGVHTVLTRETFIAYSLKNKKTSVEFLAQRP
jgi:hypothetical protein